jgi:hypothetical protein
MMELKRMFLSLTVGEDLCVGGSDVIIALEQVHGCENSLSSTKGVARKREPRC